ncbi:MAG: phosphatidate cytidylyltransferase [Geminicoccaceae bacterium]|nr:phosphatidate cytidylyltransferase [Geminicoccaceae bacterium]
MRPDLPVRVAGGLAAAAVALLAFWLGGWPLGLALALALVLMGAEWSRLTLERTDARAIARVTLPAVGAVLLLTWLLGLDRPPLSTPTVIEAMLVVALAVGWIISRNFDRKLAPLGASIYLGVPALCILWLRDQPEGFALVLWLVAIVAAADSFAYFVGSTLGGPRLAPRISPGKTWSGLIGGVAGAALVGGAAAWLLHWTVPAAAALAAMLALVSQAGDLFESWMKRRAGVKDSGALIPGHGGLLDRLDGYLFAVPVLTVILALQEVPR